MSFNRLQYDDAAYDLQMERAVKPGDYRLFQGSYDNCEECYPYNQPTNSKSQVSITRSKQEKGFGSMAEIESELTNRVNPLTQSNNYGKNDKYKNAKVFNKNLCSNQIESEDTRFTNPIDNYRGMSLTGFHFTPYLHVNPQCHIQSTRHREGNSTRLMVRDCFNSPEQDKWDKGGAFPPKPKEEPKKDCKVCCK